MIVKIQNGQQKQKMREELNKNLEQKPVGEQENKKRFKILSDNSEEIKKLSKELEGIYKKIGRKWWIKRKYKYPTKLDIEMKLVKLIDKSITNFIKYGNNKIQSGGLYSRIYKINDELKIDYGFQISKVIRTDLNI